LTTTGASRGPGTRLLAFYLLAAIVTVVVVVLVVDAGSREHALPQVAGGYDAAASDACLGSVPSPAGGVRLPATAPAQPAATGPRFNLLQSGQFVDVTNNQGTLSGTLRLHSSTLADGGLRLDGDVSCVGGGTERLRGVIAPGPSATLIGTLGGVKLAATLKRDPPSPGTANPRTPGAINGNYALSPRSTCFGGTLRLSGSGSRYELHAGGHTLGAITYSTKNGALFGDVGCTHGGHVRLTASANDQQLQTVKLIPLEVATAATGPSAAGSKPVLTTPSGLGPAGEQFTATAQRSDFNKLVAAFFLSAVIVLVVARLFGIAAAKLGQSRVMGEVIAGLVLGPSVLGAISANLQATLFPTDVLPALGVAANLGLIFYMFLVGLELDLAQLRGRASQALTISNASVALPMLLGIAVALPLYRLVGPHTKFVSFALFLGVSMSVTAFPVLARILAERRMLKRPLGALTVGCAAIDDVTAWILVALATTIAASGTFGDVLKTVGEAAAFTLLMVFVVRRILARMATAFDEVGRIPAGWFAAIVCGVLLAAYLTEEINIAFIFGGFIMGAVMPRHARLTEEVTRRIEDFVVTLLLPLFFVYTGLKTNVGLLDRPELWLITLLLVAVAVVGKLLGAATAARVSGMTWRESAVVGSLMNTRGLTELIALNLALSLGAISDALFAALVIMAVVTTVMATPLLRLLDPRNEFGSSVEDELAAATAEARLATAPERSILVAPQTDEALGQLIALAEPLARSEPAHELLIARGVTPTRGAGSGVRAGLQSENLRLERASRAINDARARLAAAGVSVRGVAFGTVSLGGDLARLVERETVDLALIEGRRRLVGEGVPLGEVRLLLEKAPCDVAVLVAREATPIALGPQAPVLVPFGGAGHDWAALELGSWLAATTGAPLTLLGAGGRSDESRSVTRMLADAALLVQQTTSVATEPLVVAGGRDGIIAAAADAGLLVIGMSERWQHEGLGPTRSEIAKAAPAPVLFVRRGSRPGIFAARDNATQFKWSLAGSLPGSAA